MFSVEESSLIKMYSGITPSREKVLTAMKAALPFVHLEDDASGILFTTMQNTIKKLEAMTDDAFETLDLSDALENTGL